VGVRRSENPKLSRLAIEWLADHRAHDDSRQRALTATKIVSRSIS